MAIQSLLSCAMFITFLLLSSSLIPSINVSASSRNLHSRRSLQSISQQYLEPQNSLRASLGLPPLRWSTTLANYAAWWANQRIGDCALIHSNSNYGENIFWGSGSKWQAADAVAAWQAEKRYYSYATNSCQPDQDCSHYTQMVWKKSEWLGCARVVCNNGDTFITCNYNPHGNVIGQKPF